MKTLPSHHDYNSLKELKALLWNHLEQVIADEPRVDKTIQNHNDNNSQIVNIHFGMTQFGRMKMLLNIYNDMKEQLRQEKRQSCDKKDHGKYDKKIAKLSVEIEKNIALYNKYESTNTNYAVVAYVMLRSMEGKNRVLQAYKPGKCRRCCFTYFCGQGAVFKKKK